MEIRLPGVLPHRQRTALLGEEGVASGNAEAAVGGVIRIVPGDAIGGILALPAADTVKKTAKDEAGVQRIAGTEDRTQLWLAQTPQMFRAGLLAQALKQAQGLVTDEASAVEQMGLKPRLVAGSRENLKVTFPEDLAIAEAILAGRK